MDEEKAGAGAPDGGAGPGGELAEERRMILRMLEAGKITPEQAVELLRALQPTPRAGEGPGGPGGAEGPRAAGAEAGPAPEPERTSEFMRWVDVTAQRLGELADELSERVSQAMSSPHVQSRLAELGERMGQLGQTLGERLGQAFGRLGRMGQPEHVLAEDLSGTFDERGVPEVELSAGNGNIRVFTVGPGEPGGGRTWRLRLVRRMRAASREEAEAEARRFVEVEQGPTRLRVRARDTEWRWGAGHSVDVELAVPEDLTVRLEASTANGSTRVQGVRAERIEARAVNGRLDLSNVTARRVSAASVNGSVVLERVCAESVEARSTNGSVTGIAAAGELRAASVNGSVTLRALDDGLMDLPGGAPGADLRHRRISASTANGSVRVVLAPELREAARRGELGLALEAESGWGAARIDVPGAALITQTVSMGQQRTVYRSPDFDRAPRTLTVEASSRHGSASISCE